MGKIDVRKLSRDALTTLRSQAMRLRQELGLPWREIARVMMQRLVQDSEQHKVFLMLDNLRAHHAKEVSAWVQTQEHEIEVFYLPPYAPQSNPDEYLNRDFKAQMRSANRCRTRDGLLEKAAAFMQFMVNSPERVKSYFQHDSVAYAA